VRALREELSWQLTLITILLVELLSSSFATRSRWTRRPPSHSAQPKSLKFAEQRTVESGWRVRERISSTLDAAALEEQRQADKAN